MVTRAWKIFGKDGEKQEESFCKSYTNDFSEGNDLHIVEVFNSDKTNTNDYTIICITSNTAAKCKKILSDQITDGIFEGCAVGEVEEITDFHRKLEE